MGWYSHGIVTPKEGEKKIVLFSECYYNVFKQVDTFEGITLLYNVDGFSYENVAALRGMPQFEGVIGKPYMLKLEGVWDCLEEVGEEVADDEIPYECIAIDFDVEKDWSVVLQAAQVVRNISWRTDTAVAFSSLIKRDKDKDKWPFYLYMSYMWPYSARDIVYPKTNDPDMCGLSLHHSLKRWVGNERNYCEQTPSDTPYEKKGWVERAFPLMGGGSASHRIDTFNVASWLFNLISPYAGYTKGNLWVDLSETEYMQVLDKVWKDRSNWR